MQMQLSPEKVNPPPNISYQMSDKFARIDNNPNVRNAQYYTPIIPTYQGSYRPEFGKNPVTSVQMYRKNKSRSINFDEAPLNQHTDTQSRKGFFSDVDWKKVLMWALIALAIAGLIVGLIFLIKALTRGGDDKNLRAYRYPDVSASTGYTGISPIYVSPVPYSRIQVPTVSGYVATTNVQQRYVYTTAPTIPQTPVTKQQSTQNYAKPTTQPTVRWTPDSTETYVNPLDVYEYHHN